MKRSIFKLGITLAILGLLSTLVSCGNAPTVKAQQLGAPAQPEKQEQPANAADLPPRISLPPDELELGSMADINIKAQREIEYGPKLVKAPEAWAANPSARGKGVKICVFDTGCDVNHKWISPNIKGTYNAITKGRDVSDGNGHGTHCVDTILQSLPDCDMYVVKVLDNSGSGSVVDIAHGLDYAITTWKIDVASFSLGGNRPDSYMPKAFARANADGCIIICAAGNDGPGANTDGWPARYPESVSTGACDANGNVANFSSRGASVFALTPGVGINAALPNNRQGKMSGTSMACPINAAGAGMWVATTNVNRVDRPIAYKEALRLACQHPKERRTQDGYGIPDFTKLIGNGTAPPAPPHVPVGSINIGPTDLTPEARAKLKAAGITGFSLTLEYGAHVTPPVPTPMPPETPVTPAPSPPLAPVPTPQPNTCVNGNCSSVTGEPVKPSRWEPFGGIFRRR